MAKTHVLQHLLRMANVRGERTAQASLRKTPDRNGTMARLDGGWLKQAAKVMLAA